MFLDDAIKYQEKALSIFDKFETQATSDYIHCLCDYANALQMRYNENKDIECPFWKYGFVKDDAGNTGKCSVEIKNTSTLYNCKKQ